MLKLLSGKKEKKKKRKKETPHFIFFFSFFFFEQKEVDSGAPHFRGVERCINHRGWRRGEEIKYKKNKKNTKKMPFLKGRAPMSMCAVVMAGEGRVSVEAGGGAGPYSYRWMAGKGSRGEGIRLSEDRSLAEGVGEGEYTVVGVDSAGREASVSFRMPIRNYERDARNDAREEEERERRREEWEREEREMMERREREEEREKEAEMRRRDGMVEVEGYFVRNATSSFSRDGSVRAVVRGWGCEAKREAAGREAAGREAAGREAAGREAAERAEGERVGGEAEEAGRQEREAREDGEVEKREANEADKMQFLWSDGSVTQTPLLEMVGAGIYTASPLGRPFLHSCPAAEVRVGREGEEEEEEEEAEEREEGGEGGEGGES